MAVIGDAVIEVTADTSNVGKSINNKFSGIAKSAAAIFAGAFAGAKAFDFVGDALAEARDAAKVARLTDAVVKSTGGAAHVSAQQLGDLADRLSTIAGVDDDVIQSAGNVLLTFTKVRNEVGKGNDIFDRAAEAALNMSAALGTDLQGATLQIGKALNDPIKGITALARAGVSFTQQQKDQIKTLVASGKTLEAQKVILAELGGEFGGAAAAAADPMQKLSVVVQNLKERIGTALLPIVGKAADWLSAHLPQALDIASVAFGHITAVIGKVADDLRPTFDAIVEGVTLFVNALRTGFTEDEGTPIENFALMLRNDLVPAIQSVVEWVGTHLDTVMKAAVAGFLLFTGPITAVVASFVLLYTRVQGFHDAVDAVIRFVRDVAAPAIAEFASYLTDQLGAAVAWVQRYWPQISEAIGHVMRAVREVIGVVVDAVSALWRAWGDDLLAIVRQVWGFIHSTIENEIRLVQAIIRTVVALINGDWGKAWDGIKDAVGAVWDQIRNIVGTALGVLKSLLGGAVSTLAEIWRGGWDKLTGLLGGVWNQITDAVSHGKDRVVEIIRGLPGTIGDALGGLASTFYNIGKDLIGSLWDGIYDQTVGKLKTGLKWVTDKIPSWKGPLSTDRKLLEPTGRAIMEGLLSGIHASTGPVQAYLQAFTADIITQVQGALGAIRAVGSVNSAQRQLRDAQKNAKALTDRQAALPALLRDAAQDLEKARAAAEVITPSEQLRIDRARQDVIDKTAALAKVTADSTASALDAAIARDELTVASEELTAAQREAVGVTDEVTAAADRLSTLRQEQRDIANQVADAEQGVRDAQQGVLDATLALDSATSQLSNNTSLIGWLRDIAREAGLSEGAIQHMVDTINSVRSPMPLPGPATGPVVQVPGGGQVGADFAAWFAQQPKSVQDALLALGPGFNQATHPSVAQPHVTATVNFQSIDTKGLMERMNIKAAVGEAISTSTRLRPIG